MFEEFDEENPGMAFAVLRDGAVVLRECRGLAELETRTPVTPSTNFRIASVTKPFIAEAIAVLVARGLLRYEDEVFLGATVQQLLTHTAGLADYEELLDADRTEQVSDAEVLRLLEGTRRDTSNRFHYSNSAYVILGIVIERISGRSLESFLHDEIFAKHGMHATTLGIPTANRAYGYDRDGDRWVRRDQSITSATRGDGGIYSNIEDLSRWVASLRNDVPLVDTDVQGMRYGLGWFFTSDTIEHYGDTVSFRSAIVRWPAENTSVIVLMNRNESDPLVAAGRIRDYYLEL